MASQSPVAMRETNSRRRSPARSSLVAIRTAAQGYRRTNSAVYCSSMWFGTMWAGLAARPSRRSSMLAATITAVLPAPTAWNSPVLPDCTMRQMALRWWACSSKQRENPGSFRCEPSNSRWREQLNRSL